MASRLDRLFVLLESGSTPFTRQAAAKQLGELQRLHPHELHHLLKRTYKLLHHTSWDTRIAASQAVEAIISHTPVWDPLPWEEAHNSEQKPLDYQADRLSLDKFDLRSILENSSCLTASQGKEFDMEDDGAGTKDSLQRARQQLKTRLGFALMDNSVADQLVTQDDVIDVKKESENAKPNISEIINMLGESPNASMSSREMNRARRKARQAMYSRQKSNSETGEGPSEKKMKTEDVESEKDPLYAQDGVPNIDGTWGEANEWPLDGFFDRLCQDLFSPSWEVRHGVATALREVIKVHGRGVGKYVGQTREQMLLGNQSWLEDVCVRLLCILSLDRFGDFVSDQVVAPVRETSAQALGVVSKLLKKESVAKVVDLLLELVEQKEWEARHGGLLGIKYVLAVNTNLVADLLPKCLPKIINGLSDPVDDVGNIAAATLIPVADQLILNHGHTVTDVMAKLWKLLEEHMQLACACNNFMELLAALITHPQSHSCLTSEPVMEVIPRLWPFIAHTSSSVRKATLQTMAKLTSVGTSLDCSINTLQSTLRHVFQRVLIEHVFDIQDLLEKVWENIITRVNLNTLLMAVCPFISNWLCLAMQPHSVPFDSKQLICIDLPTASSTHLNGDIESTDLKYYVGGVETVPILTREANVFRARYIACRLLGLLSLYVIQPMPGVVYVSQDDNPVECYVKVLLVYLTSKSALQRQVSGLVICDWNQRKPLSPPHPTLVSTLHKCVEENIYYNEMGGVYTKLLQDTTDLISFMKHYKIQFNYDAYNKVLTLDEIEHLMSNCFATIFEEQKPKSKHLEKLNERRKSILSSAQTTKKEQLVWHIMVQAILAGALLQMKFVPQKINPVIKPLMDSIKFESNKLLQSLSATHLAILISLCVERSPCPNNKIISNLCTFLCCDPECTPIIETYPSSHPPLLRTNSDLSTSSSGFSSEPTTPLTPNTPLTGPTTPLWGIGNSSSQLEDTSSKAQFFNNEGFQTSVASNSSSVSTQLSSAPNNNYVGILTLIKQQQIFEKAKTVGRGRPSVSSSSGEMAALTSDDQESDNLNQVKIQSRGSTLALKAIATHFGIELPEKLPKLWEKTKTFLETSVDPKNFDTHALVGDDKAAEVLVSSLQVFEVIVPSVHPSLLQEFLSLQSHLGTLLSHPYRAVRHMASRCLATLACLDSVAVMTFVLSQVVPLLGATYSDTIRQGAVEAIANILDSMQIKVVPFIVLLVVPLLARVSDQDTPVRLMSTSCFATCIELMPLDGSVPDPPNLTSEFLSQRAAQQDFLKQLFDPKLIPDLELPMEFNCQLRSYQRAGVNWLWFLNRYNMHGILCDDMGLGKTLQSICVLAADHYFREENFKKTQSPDSKPMPSLVVCPPTLTGHWFYEVQKFVSTKYLNPIQYAGPPLERERIRSKMSSHNLVIVSYEMIRKDLQVFSNVKWNYCILDEGHVIKNGKAKSTRAIKQLRANHRLILSGTPIQNNVLELWSLFDFLMPGFLGTEKQFITKYSRPILNSRDPKASLKEQEAGVLAMEALHRQVLPLVLRRMKEDVLKDLPPKITQDYYCDLSPLQEKLYEDFSKVQNEQQTNHVFQALRYLQNVCNHPKLVLTPAHPEYTRLITNSHVNLNEIKHACKLPALKQLLLDCGIGCMTSSSSSADLTSTETLTQHRALIFCQLKAMINILEQDLFKAEMPGVTYLRLDGSVPPTSRHAIVTKFNNDPTIDVLLLTTQVGGLGLNLTGADTVIFVEHDWSPMKDLQAMDRVHRIGQKKIVNVYRLITKHTLEEKIMNLQKFKLFTANTVINNENTNLATMSTDTILDLFRTNSNTTEQKDGETSSASSKTNCLNNLLENLPELWDDSQYDDQYDLNGFLSSLNTQPQQPTQTF